MSEEGTDEKEGWEEEEGEEEEEEENLPHVHGNDMVVLAELAQLVAPGKPELQHREVKWLRYSDPPTLPNMDREVPLETHEQTASEALTCHRQKHSGT